MSDQDNPRERLIRQALADAHQQDRAPEFGPMWARAEAGKRANRGRGLIPGLALAGTLAGAIALAVVLMPGGGTTPTGPDAGLLLPAIPEMLTVPESVAALEEWTAPTDFLLEGDSDALLDATTGIGDAESTVIPGLEESYPDTQNRSEP